MTFFEEFFIAALLGSLSVTLGACVGGSSDDQSSNGSCDLKTRCLNDAITCLTGQGVYNQSQVNYDSKIQHLEQEIAKLKAELSNAGQAGGFARLDHNGRLPQSLLVAGYDQFSAYDLGWQSLHMAAAAACRGSTPSGGSGCCENQVMARNTADNKSCRQICAQTSFTNCDAEVSVYGRERKATQNGEAVGAFYNYNCDGVANGGSEASAVNEGVMSHSSYFSFCCCRK